MFIKSTTVGALLSLLFFINAQAQHSKNTLDSLYINETEDHPDKPAKVLHAEPLYIDLIRDLGARKGEKEWNVGMGLLDHNTYDRYEALVEYEWAPMDRLGLEVELPFSFYYPLQSPNSLQNSDQSDTVSAPSSGLESLKLAWQYTILVSEKYKTSLAVGYIHEFEINNFSQYGKGKFFTGNVYNPFFIAAKRWGQNFHTLIYTGPVIAKHFDSPTVDTHWQFNSNIHYMIPGTRNFLGIEFNKEMYHNDFDMTIRPQMRVEVTENIMIGIVTGIPISRESERFSSFLRLIYEP